MYIVESKYSSYKGDHSTSVMYDRGVYNFKRDSKPVEGEELRIECGHKKVHSFKVVKIVSESDDCVEFQTAEFATYKWKKVS